MKWRALYQVKYLLNIEGWNWRQILLLNFIKTPEAESFLSQSQKL